MTLRSCKEGAGFARCLSLAFIPQSLENNTLFPWQYSRVLKSVVTFAPRILYLGCLPTVWNIFLLVIAAD